MPAPEPTRPPRRTRPRVPRRGRSWPRRALAALLAAAAVGLTSYLALDRPTADGVPVLVATATVPVGAVVSADDVEVRRVPAAAVPEGALEGPAAAVGLPAAAVLSVGEVLTSHDVRTGSLLAGRAEGELAVWLPLPDPQVAAALSAGDVVDVRSPVDGRLVVASVRVLAAPAPGAGADAGLVRAAAGAAGPAGGHGAWLAVSPEQSGALAAARGADPAGTGLLVALHPAG